MKTFALALLATAFICPCAEAQRADAATLGLASKVEKGSIGSLGARVSLMFAGSDRPSTGLEFGYARLAGIESEFTIGPDDQSVVQWERANRKLWHATFAVRSQWLNTGARSGIYAGGGTGLYYLSTKSEFWEQDGSGLGQGPHFRESNAYSLHFGANLGGGWSLHPKHGPGAIDFDVRFHVLPFAGGAVGLRSVLTFSAGLKVF